MCFTALAACSSVSEKARYPLKSAPDASLRLARGEKENASSVFSGPAVMCGSPQEQQIVPHGVARKDQTRCARSGVGVQATVRQMSAVGRPCRRCDVAVTAGSALSLLPPVVAGAFVPADLLARGGRGTARRPVTASLFGTMLRCPTARLAVSQVHSALGKSPGRSGIFPAFPLCAVCSRPRCCHGRERRW